MIDIEIPGFGRLQLAHLVLDYNGTLAIDGEPFEGSDEEWQGYLTDMLPTEEDEERLMNEYMQQEWIQYREWKGE